jgi:hypothetical protein
MVSRNNAMRRTKVRPQVVVDICINHATADEREQIRHAIAEALATATSQWAKFDFVQVTDYGWLN